MRILAIGSTIKKTLFGVFRAIRVDGDGYVQTVSPAGSPSEVNLTEIDGNGVETGGIAGSLAVGGASAVGAVPTSDPLPMGAVDEAGNTQIPIVGTTDHSLFVSGDVPAGTAKTTSHPLKNGVVARNVLPTALTEDQVAELIGDLYGRVRTHDASFSELGLNLRTEITNRAEDAFNDDPIAVVSNGADGTYYYYIDLRGYSDLSIDPILSDGSGSCTLSIEAAMANGAIAKESLTYTDVGVAAFGGAASWTAATAVPLIDTAGYFKRWCWARIKIVALTGSDDADWTLLKRQNKA